MRGNAKVETVGFLVKILPCLYTAKARSVSEPLPWVRNTKTENSTVLSEPPSCVETPRSRRIWFPNSNPPLPLYGKGEVSKQSKHLPWVRNTKIGNSMVLSKRPFCVGTSRLRTKRLPIKILPCLYTARARSERGTSLPCLIRQGQYGSQLYISFTPMWKGRDQLSEPLPCLVRQGREQYGS